LSIIAAFGGGGCVPSTPDHKGVAIMTSSGKKAQRQETLDEQNIKALEARRARLRALWAMTVSERIAAMRNGELSLEQCAAWAARYPEQVPLLNGEFEYLAAFTPEVAE
jgi:hypothetical protein